MAAVKQVNGKDWWLILHGNRKDSSTNNTFYTVSVAKDTVIGPFLQIVGTKHIKPNTDVSQLTFSKDGNWLANTLMDQNGLDLFRFNRCSGNLHFLTTLKNIDSSWSNPVIYGCEFSSSGKYLFISENNGNNVFGRNGIYQYCLDTTDINASKKIIWQDSGAFNSGFAFGDLRRAPNNKIYLAMLGGPGAPYSPTNFDSTNQYLWVINNPDSSGDACNFQPYGYYLGDSARTYYALPNMPNYNLGPLPIYTASAGEDRIWCKDTTAGVIIGSTAVANITYQWQPTAGLSNPNIAQPIASPDSSTYYVLTVTDTSQGSSSCTSRMDTVFVRVEVCMGIGETNIPTVKVYPNPASNLLIVESSATLKSTFVLYDLVGHRVVETPLRDLKTSVDVSSLPTGFYFYRVGTASGKVQVVR